MSSEKLARRLDPSALDPSRGLERLACDWALFGLALDPDDWLGASTETQRAIAKVWRADDGWRADHPGAFHGLIVGARADLRALRSAGVYFRNRFWADLGGADGHYAIALVLEGAADAELIDESAPGPLARAALDALRIRVRVEDATRAKLPFVDGVLALYSIDPEPVTLASARVETVIFAPASDRGASYPLFDTRVVSWTSRFAMGEGCCALRDEPASASVEVRERAGRKPFSDEAPRRTIGDLANDAMQRLTNAAGQPPDVVPVESVVTQTGVRLVDVGLGGLARGVVHLVTSAVPDARLGVLAELALVWPYVEDLPALFAGRASEHTLADALLASASGVRRGDLARGALEAHGVRRLLETTRELPVRIAAGIRVATDLDAYRDALGAINAIFADIDTLDAADLVDWQRLARTKRLTIVLGVDPRAPGLSGHAVPELRLVAIERALDGIDIIRFAARGVRVDGAPSPKIVCDVESDSLALTMYEPPSEHAETPKAEPLGWALAVSPDDAWVLR